MKIFWTLGGADADRLHRRRRRRSASRVRSELRECPRTGQMTKTAAAALLIHQLI